MAQWSPPIDIRIADLPKMRQFMGSVAALLRALAECDDLPEPVIEAADRIRRDAAALGGRDVGPPPDAAPSDEDRIRDAMTEAMDHPGRTITR